MQRCLFVLHVLLSLAAPTYGIPIEEYARFKRRSRTGDCASSSLRAHSIACGWWLDGRLADWRPPAQIGLADTAASNLEAVCAFSWRKGSHRLDDASSPSSRCGGAATLGAADAERVRRGPTQLHDRLGAGAARALRVGLPRFEWRFKEGLTRTAPRTWNK